MQIFENKIAQLISYLDDSNFHACNRISRKLITLSELSDYPDGVFIAEVLESLYNQLEDLVDRYNVDKDDLNRTVNVLKEQSNNIIQSLKDKNNLAIYEILREMRCKTTTLQIKTFDQGKMKDESSFLKGAF